MNDEIAASMNRLKNPARFNQAYQLAKLAVQIDPECFNSDNESQEEFFGSVYVFLRIAEQAIARWEEEFVSG